MRVGVHSWRVARNALLAILLLGLTGTGVELLFLGHYEGALQIIPLVLIGLGLGVVLWYAMVGSSASVRVMRVTMAMFVAAGAAGMVLHYLGNIEFQREVDPSIEGFALFTKAMRAKAPPALAPGSMAQLGLLGLVCTYGFAQGRNET